MKLQFVRASQDDIQEICDLADDVIVRYEDFHTLDREKALGWTHMSIAQNIDRFAVIKADGHKAGYLLMTPGKGRYEINHLYVLPYFQNKGIGTAVVKQCIKETAGNLQVYVFTGDLSTYGLFESLGFKVQEVYHRTRYLMVYAGVEEKIDDDGLDTQFALGGRK